MRSAVCRIVPSFPAWLFGLLAGCSRPGPPDRPAAGAPADAAPAFADKVWQVGDSSGGDPGAFYVFLSDGTLLIASAHGTPSLGRWRAGGDSVTLVEEGIAHPARVLELSPRRFAIRFGGPGDPLEIHFVPGEQR